MACPWHNTKPDAAGLAQAGLKSSVVPETFKKYVDVMQAADPHAMLEDARAKAKK